jgi:sulfate adenylyltransferase subunit 1
MTETSVQDLPNVDLLRLATAGSVDDGKSTLVGRLLYDTKSVQADQLDAVERASIDSGKSTPDLSLLVDGLRAEREQGITIDVAYRYFATPARSFVLADTPGHVQYTRNTVTGASTAGLAILLVDASIGVVDQTRRHAAVLALLGVPRLVLAVNKVDLIDYDQATYDRIAAEFTSHTARLGYSPDAVLTVPVSALHGDNIVHPSEHTPWYTGPTLLHHLETVPVDADPGRSPARFPVQYVIRPGAGEHADYRGYAGQLASGVLAVGDTVTTGSAGTSTITGIDGPDGPLTEVTAGRSVTLRLADDMDIGRGDMIAATDDPPRSTDMLDATVCWMAETSLRPGAKVLVKHGTRTVQGIVRTLHTRLDEQNLTVAHDPDELGLNDIGQITIQTSQPLPVDEYTVSHSTGAFLVIDPGDGTTLAAGLVGNSLPLDTVSGENADQTDN